jgi:hypothetical protein
MMQRDAAHSCGGLCTFGDDCQGSVTSSRVHSVSFEVNVNIPKHYVQANGRPTHADSGKANAPL